VHTTSSNVILLIKELFREIYGKIMHIIHLSYIWFNRCAGCMFGECGIWHTRNPSAVHKIVPTSTKVCIPEKKCLYWRWVLFTSSRQVPLSPRY